MKLHRPILVGGLGLTVILWGVNSLQHQVAQVGGFSSMGLGAIALGLGWFWLRWRSSPAPSPSPSPTCLEPDLVQQAFTELEACLKQLSQEVTTPAAQRELAQLENQARTLAAQGDNQPLQLVMVGGQAVGKTTLVQYLAETWVPRQSQELALQDTPALGFGSTTPELEQIADADLLLFLIVGDLTAPEYEMLQALCTRHHRVLLVLNKQDHHLPAEQPVILHQVRQRVQGLLDPIDVVAIAAAPQTIKIRRYSADYTLEESTASLVPVLEPLTDHLGKILVAEMSQLRLGTRWRQAQSLKQTIQAALNRSRRERALPLIETCQWSAGIATFVNPIPSLDVLALVAVQTQLVLDLGNVYHHTFSLKQAQQLAKTLAEGMLKLGLVELSTQTVGVLLKSHAFTYVAGGLVQGVSAAYLTRIAGLSLMTYFETIPGDTTSPTWPWQNLQQTVQDIFQQHQQSTVLKDFVGQALSKLRGHLASRPHPDPSL